MGSNALKTCNCVILTKSPYRKKYQYGCENTINPKFSHADLRCVSKFRNLSQLYDNLEGIHQTKTTGQFISKRCLARRPHDTKSGYHGN